MSHDPTVLPANLPAPVDDGAADHLRGTSLPAITLKATVGSPIQLNLLRRAVIFIYPRTGVPGKSPGESWDLIPGARGCTPQTCAFRDLFKDLQQAGARHVFGLSTQDSAYQREMVERLHVPFQVLSDSGLALTRALGLPTMTIADMILIKRLALIIDDAVITHVFYPVFPPDRNAGDVLAWLQANPLPSAR